MNHITWELFKAIKYQINECAAEHGFNLAGMVKIIKANDPAFSEFWRNECLRDYRYMLAEQSKLEFWLVSKTSVDWSTPMELIAVVPDRATAKSIARHHHKGDKAHDFVIEREPMRWT